MASYENTLYSGKLYRRFAEAHLDAAGFEDTASILNRLYTECMPENYEFEQEVRYFATHYREAMEKAAYLREIESLAGENASKYKTLYEKGRTSEGRLSNGGSKYRAELNKIPAFDPCSLQEYYYRFDDFPVHVHQEVYEKSFLLAIARLQAINS